MAAITFFRHLPFVSVKVSANEKSIVLTRVLLDTGSAATVFRTEDMKQIGVVEQLTDIISTMSGMGGSEYVIEKQVETVEVNGLSVHSFTIQMGEMDDDFPMDGIIGADFLLAARAIIDFDTLEIRRKSTS
jgi:hypothetical protein